MSRQPGNGATELDWGGTRGTDDAEGLMRVRMKGLVAGARITADYRVRRRDGPRCWTRPLGSEGRGTPAAAHVELVQRASRVLAKGVGP